MTNHFPIENTFTTQLFEDEVVKKKESTPFFSLLLTVKRSEFGPKRSSALQFINAVLELHIPYARHYKRWLVYIFYPIFQCGLSCRAVNITDNLCTKHGYSSIYGPKIHSL